MRYAAIFSPHCNQYLIGYADPDEPEQIAAKAPGPKAKPLVNVLLGVSVAKMFLHKMQRNYN